MDKDEYNTPEHRLWAAVLFQAIHDVHIRETEKNRRYWRDDARAWCAINRTDIGSFAWICELFDLNSQQVRSIVLGEET